MINLIIKALIGCLLFRHYLCFAVAVAATTTAEHLLGSSIFEICYLEIQTRIVFDFLSNFILFAAFLDRSIGLFV